MTKRPSAGPGQGQGPVVAIVAASSPLTFPGASNRLRRSIAFLEASGRRVIIDQSCFVHGDGPASRRARANALNRTFEDPDIDLVMSAVGGDGATDIVGLLNFELLKQHPKYLVGYSDFSAVLLGAHAAAGLVAIDGPSALPQLGGDPGLASWSLDHLSEVLRCRTEALTIEGPGEIETERGDWQVGADPMRARPERAVPVVSGEAEGPLIVANLEILTRLAGTRFCPDLEGAVLLIEHGDGASAAQVCDQLASLAARDVFDAISGLGVGTCAMANTDAVAAVHQWISMAQTRGMLAEMPVAVGLPFGHTSPRASLPIGEQARFDVDAEASILLMPKPTR